MQILDQIRNDYENGANFLARRSCEILKGLISCQTREDIAALKGTIKEYCQNLYNLRPSMVNINNTAALLYHELSRIFSLYPVSDPIPALVQRIDEIILDFRKVVIKSAHEAEKLIPEGAALLTHSKSLAVAKAIDLANAKNLQVYVTESRPHMEGQRMAGMLNEWLKIPAFVITDAEVSHFMPRIDMVLVGCDSILPDGCIVNKIGTSTIALCAHEYKKPIYCIGDTYKISSLAEAVSLEEVPSSQSSTEFPEIKNVYFDKTSHEYLTGIISEWGVMSPEDIADRVENWSHLEKELMKS